MHIPSCTDATRFREAIETFIVTSELKLSGSLIFFIDTFPISFGEWWLYLSTVFPPFTISQGIIKFLYFFRCFL